MLPKYVTSLKIEYDFNYHHYDDDDDDNNNYYSQNNVFLQTAISMI